MLGLAVRLHAHLCVFTFGQGSVQLLSGSRNCEQRVAGGRDGAGRHQVEWWVCRISFFAAQGGTPRPKVGINCRLAVASAVVEQYGTVAACNSSSSVAMKKGC